MEYSIREAKANFAQATNAAANGERVVITKHGKPFVEIVPVEQRNGLTLEKLDEARRMFGSVEADARWFDEFISNPEASRRVLGLED